MNTAFYFILISIHIEIGTEIIYCSTIDEYPYQRLLIMGNIILSVLFTMFSVCAYMSKTTIQISLISVLSYTVCVFITNGPFLTNYLPIIIIIFTVKSLFGILLHRNISCLQQENDMLKKEESTLLKVLQVNREELFALAELISKEISEDNINSLLDVVGEKTRKTLFMALHAHLKEEKSRLEIIRKIYPELSPSELSICRLILQDKTVSQICEELHRSSGNITSQRANIRAKFKLKKGDNLKEYLQERMKQYEEQYESTT